MQERQEDVISKCEMADPHHGPIWQATLKDLDNRGKSTREILELVADRLV
jgi:pre-mRNA-processing factor 6